MPSEYCPKCRPMNRLYNKLLRQFRERNEQFRIAQQELGRILLENEIEREYRREAEQQLALAHADMDRLCAQVAMYLARARTEDDDEREIQNSLLEAFPESVRQRVAGLCKHGLLRDDCQACAIQRTLDHEREQARLLSRRVDDLSKAFAAVFSILKNEERTEPVRGAKRIISEALERMRCGQFG